MPRLRAFRATRAHAYAYKTEERKKIDGTRDEDRVKIRRKEGRNEEIKEEKIRRDVCREKENNTENKKRKEKKTRKNLK